MERGGRPDKFGNDFEKFWVVEQALLLLSGDARWLKWEPLGSEGEGVDLVIETEDALEVHQCKRSNRNEGKWTIRELFDRGVLSAIQKQLETERVDRFVFVSKDRSDLDYLAERADHCDYDPETFRRHSLSGALQSAFGNLCKYWHLDPDNAKDVSSALRLLSHCSHGYGMSKRRLFLLSGQLVEGDGRKTVDALGRFLFEELGNRVHPDQLRRFLVAEGLPPRDRSGDRRVADGIEFQKTLFRDLLEPDLIAGDLLPRKETQELLALISDPAGPRILILHGTAGAGKTGVMLELARVLEERGVPYLPLRLDNQRLPRISLDAYSRSVLELPDPPQLCLHYLAGDRASVLIIDQLDAIRWAGPHSNESWVLCRQMIDSAVDLPGMKVVLSSRTFDLHDHPQIHMWEKGREAKESNLIKRLEIGKLPKTAVTEIVDESGGDYDLMSPQQRSLLLNAHNLQLWDRLIQRGALPSAFATKSDLIEAYWTDCSRRARQNERIAEDSFSEALNRLVTHLDDQRVLVAPELLLRESQDVLSFLKSEGVVHCPRKQLLRFCHQSHLDYLIAARVAEEALEDESRPIEWIRHDQSLFRRERLRLLLLLLRDQRHAAYLGTLKGLLKESEIRFHLRHLALGFLRAVDEPTNGETTLVLELLEDTHWRERVLSQVLRGSCAWFDRLAEQGLWMKWLASEEEMLIKDALDQCRASVETRGAVIFELLLPYWSDDLPEWRPRIARVLSHDPKADTPELFEWRLTLAQSDAPGLTRWYQLLDLVESHPRRVLELVGLLVQRGGGRLATGSLVMASDEMPIDSTQAAKIVEAGAAEPAIAWKRLLPLVPALWQRLRAECPYYDAELDMDGDMLGIRPDAFVFWVTLSTLRRAIEMIARSLPGPELFSLVETLERSSEALPPLRWLCLRALAAADDQFADSAIKSLSSTRDSFETKLFGRLEGTEPAESVLKRFAPICSRSVYEALEELVLRHFPDKEWQSRRRTAQYNLRLLKEGKQPPLWRCSVGQAQKSLLEALPTERMSGVALGALRSLRRKFVGTHSDLNLTGGYVGSPIPAKRYHLVSDFCWRHIIGTDWTRENRATRHYEEHMTEVSHRMFSDAFQQAAHMQPSRFVGLILNMVAVAPRALPLYIDALLLALAEAKAPEKFPEELRPWRPASTSEIESIFRCVPDRSKRETARRFCSIVARRSEEVWSAEVLSYIANLAATHPDPESDYQFTPLSEDTAYVGAYIAPSNTVRGAAAQAIYRLLFDHEELLELFLPSLRALAGHPHVIVRAAVRDTCLAVLKWKRDLAVDLYLQACDHPDDQALVPNPFLQYAWWTHSEALEALFERMLASRFPSVVKQAASCAVAAWVIEGRLPQLAKSCVAAEDVKLEGAFQALAGIFEHRSELRDRCWEIIQDSVIHMGDTDDSSLARLLREQEILSSDWGPRIATKILNRGCFRGISFWLVHSLKDYEGPLEPYAGSLRALIEGLMRQDDEETRQIRWRLDEVPSLLLRLYDEAEERESEGLRELCLDAWDRLLESGLGGTLGQLELLDRSD